MDPLSIATGGAGLISLLVQLIGGVNTLRDIAKCADKAPAKLSILAQDLACLEYGMKELLEKALRNDNLPIQRFYDSCKLVAEDLEELRKLLPTTSLDNTRKRKKPKVIAFRHFKTDVDDLEQNLQKANMYKTQ